MGAVQFFNGAVLFRNGAVAMDPKCCCNAEPVSCDCPSGLPETVTTSSWEQYVYYATTAGGTYRLFNHQTQASSAVLTKDTVGCAYTGLVTFHNEIYKLDGTLCYEEDAESTVTLFYGKDEHGNCRWLYNNYAFHHSPSGVTPEGDWAWDHFDTFSAPSGCDWTEDYDFSHQFGTWVVVAP